MAQTPTADQASKALDIVEHLEGPKRLPSTEQCERAGIDPTVAETIVNMELERCGEARLMALMLDPALAVMLGIVIAATVIDHQRSALEAEINS